MLNPNTRHTYLQELRPPEGYRLDLAVATTFSLDLMSLLLAPVSMALTDYRVDKEALNDPIALLEAIQRVSQRYVVFCQQGRIGVPSSQTPLYAHLEPMVVEVRARHKEGVFHPKTWFMRFADDSGASPPLYRFICLTRNLTLDRSWDTALVMEGELVERRSRGFGVNRPLGDFVGSLKMMAVKRQYRRIRRIIDTVADEIKRVRFETPEGFSDEYRFFPSGIPGYKRQPQIDETKRSLVLSPFISHSILKEALQSGNENIVISRAESLEEVSDEQFEELSELADFFIMDSAAEIQEDAQEEAGTDIFSDAQRGLHAKLMVFENGWDARMFTGSANATDAAFKGRNVELNVELSAKRKTYGINSLLGDENATHTLRSMLRPYRRAKGPDTSENVLKKIEKKLDEARRRISDAGLRVWVDNDGTGEYRQTIRVGKKGLYLPSGVTGRFYPISLGDVRTKNLSELVKAGEDVFDKLTAESLTRFIAFELIGKQKSEKLCASFVLNLPASGIPADRDKQVVRSILKDQDRFIRYLMLILGNETYSLVPPQAANGNNPFHWHFVSPWGIPLFEEMVRAFSRDPDKIQRVERLVRDLRGTGDVGDVLPEGFDDLWKAFKRAQRLRG